MHIRSPRTLAVGAVLPLLAGMLAILPGAGTASAGAACAPSQVVAEAHAHAPARAKVMRSRPSVTRRHKHAYVARVVLTLTQGRASVRLVTGICPDGAAGVAVSTSQTASGTGVLHRTVSGKGRTSAAARKDARRSARRVSVALRHAATSKKARRKAEKRAIAAARSAAARKAHDALYLSDIVYAVAGADQVYHLSATPPSGQVRLTRAANGDLVLSVPAGFRWQDATSKPCVRRAPAWPTRFVFDGGDLVAPALRAAAAASASGAQGFGINAAPYQDLEGVAPGQEADAQQSWFGGWISPANGPGTPQYDAEIAPISPYAGALVCFAPNVSIAPAYTAVVHGAHVGTAATSNGTVFKVVGGLPVAAR
ncbi:hypothetical protein P5P86_00295 [Nocardioides sp. BP30]|uniref:hypothetical protein n=1 Tax=Nocardioides sp. BP30 TaxID=3036374 RepID=UPI002468A69D|nr:hypothetical protein [Nocardioides sp. BP30]WGL52286.1 hypothetical protein P5P86_00295 [Nocardioides sp. BP30]